MEFVAHAELEQGSKSAKKKKGRNYELGMINRCIKYVGRVGGMQASL